METELRLSRARCNTLKYLDLKDSTEATEEIWVKPRKLDCSADVMGTLKRENVIW